MEHTVGYILCQSSIEHHRILQYDAELAAKRLQLHFANIDPVNQDTSGVNVPVSHEQRGQCRLSTSRRADQGNRHPWLYGK